MHRLPSLVFLLAFAAACGPTNGEVIDSYKPKMDAVRDKLTKLAATLPAPAAIRPGQKTAFDPPLTRSNTDFLHYEHLLDVYADAPLDFHLQRDLKTALSWSGPKNPLRTLDDTADGMDQNFERALAKRYLVIHRTVKIQLPVATSATEFKQGGAFIEGFVVDLESSAVRASYAFVATNSKQVGYRYRKGDDPVRGLQTWARSDLWTNARKKIAAALQTITGDDFGIK